jgi:hypothetical protein
MIILVQDIFYASQKTYCFLTTKANVLMLIKVVNAVSPAYHTKLVNTLRDKRYSNCVFKQLLKRVERP